MIRTSVLLSSAALVAMIPATALAQATPTGDRLQPGAVAPGAANTQADDGDSALYDVIVTAQRREQSVQDIPLAVTAFSQAELERRNITSTLQVTQYVPNLIGHNNTGPATANSYYIRGLGNTDTLPTFDVPVGTYVDDVLIARQSATSFGLFDVERLEVLRGPQGTLFGRNTTGGAINVILRKPAAQFGGMAEVGAGNYGHLVGRASVDIPLSPNVLTKLSGYYDDRDGYVRNVTTGEKLNDLGTWGLRGAVTVKFGGGSDWNFSAIQQHTEGTNLINLPCDTTERGRPASCSYERFAITGLRRAQPTLTNLVVGVPGLGNVPTTLANGKANKKFGSFSDTTLLSSNLQIDLGGVTLNAITGYLHNKNPLVIDLLDGRQGRSLTRPDTNVIVNGAGVVSPNGAQTLVQTIKSDQFSQELKLVGDAFDKRLTYVAGFYYIYELNRTDTALINTTYDAPGPNFTVSPPGPYTTAVLQDFFLRNTTSAYAGYAQADFNLTDTLSLTAGIRYTDETKKLQETDQRDPRVTPTFQGRPARVDTANIQAFYPTTLRTRRWTPRFAVNFKPSADTLFFATATRGFRSGGWNARGGSAQLINNFRPEDVWSYETGFKTEFFNRRLRLNLTLFDEETKNLQLPASATINGAVVFLSGNDSDLRVRGLELEYQAIPVDNLTLFGSVGYQDARYRNPSTEALARQGRCRTGIANNDVALFAANCGSGIITAQGNIAEPVRAPKVSLALGASYRLETGAGFAVTPTVNFIHYGREYVGISNITAYRAADGSINYNGNGTYLSGAKIDPYSLVNASLAFETDDRLWRVTAECDNCFNKLYGQSITGNYTFFGPPHTWIVKVRRNF